MENKTALSAGVMLNAYPDSMGGTLADIVALLGRGEMKGAFDAFYILPSIFNTDLDRGFSVIDYNLNECYAGQADLDALRKLGIDLKFDLILNHASVLSPQFQDLLKNGENSRYKDFFINWNKFWAGHGQMTQEGYIQPDAELIKDMFFRKPGLPILMVRMPDGSEVPYWNTFYQEVRYRKVDASELVESMGIQYQAASRIADLVNAALERGEKPAAMDFGAFQTHKAAVVDHLESRRSYLGQMDLNVASPLVWEFYDETLHKLADYGAKIIRLDAFAYAPKTPGAKNFLNEPDTWQMLQRVGGIAQQYGLSILPEIHASYGEKTHEKLCEAGCMTYDFFLPGLILDAFEHKNFEYLVRWIDDIQQKGMRVVNMLGCHDGIPLLDLKGLLPEERILAMVETLKGRGGLVKDLHGAKNMYYQVNCTYYSALGESDRKMLMARALQLFMPGKPQVWYLDLFAGKNDLEAVCRGGGAGHKEINRTNLSLENAVEKLEQPVVRRQLELLRLRNSCPVFGWDATLTVENPAPAQLTLRWEKEGHTAALTMDLAAERFAIEVGENGKTEVVFQEG